MASVRASVEPRRVAVIEPVGEGGMVHYVYHLCQAFADEGANVTLWTSSRYELSELPHRFEVDTGMQLWPAHDGQSNHPGRAARIVALVKRYVRRGWRAARLGLAWRNVTRRVLKSKPDLIIITILPFPFAARTIARLKSSGALVFEVAHEYDQREWTGRVPGASLLIRLRGRAHGRADAVLVHGVENRRKFLATVPSFDPQKVHPIEHGSAPLSAPDAVVADELRARYGLDDSPLAVLVGSIRHVKGVEDLMDAIGLIDPSVQFKVVIAGHPTAGFDVGALERRMEDPAIGGRVVLDLRYLSNVQLASLLDLASLVVLPYRSATQSGVLHQAYAHGRPVLVTRVGGLPEAVDDGVTGVVVPPADLQALADALARLLGDPDRLVAMGRAARERAASSHDWRAIAAGINDIATQLRPSAELP